MACQGVGDALSLGWAKRWRTNGWMRNKKDPALNPDLWEELLNLTARHEMKYVWIKGHAGHPQNERCDELAVLPYAFPPEAERAQAAFVPMEDGASGDRATILTTGEQALARCV